MTFQSPRALFSSVSAFEFVPARDARTFYAVYSNPDSPARELRVVQNWLSEAAAALGTP